MKDPQYVSDQLSETLESLRRAIETNPREPPTEAAEPLSTPVIQLPLWPGHRRAAPNALFRSALFPPNRWPLGLPNWRAA